MRITKVSNLLFVAIMALAAFISAVAQDKPAGNTPQATQNNTSQTAAQPTRVAAGRKQKASGVIVGREADKITMRDVSGVDMVVNVTGSTKITEKKANPFRGAKNYPVTALLRGLEIEVEGRGSDSGTLIADKIRFTDNDFGVARSIDSRAVPLEQRATTTEGRVDTAETRITAAEQNAQRLSGQLEELSAVANTARGGAKAAQETADTALAAAKAASADVQATNDRISQIDNYDKKQEITVNFKVNSYALSDEAKAALDEIAAQAKNEKGYLIQVTGYASSDGSEAKNRILSEHRAEAVRRYLAENHDIPLQRIINPFGFGELKPVADNDTREGRKQNRRVEVAILVNKGLTTPISGTAQSSRN
ncbi:MAG TPA: OmpA family protein [Blastocatellia bacterium]|nr:OmpA family protein [Blastocatellia bacterium]